MAFDITQLLNEMSLYKADKLVGYSDIVLNIQDIVITKHNKYSMEAIEELATGIQLAGELQQPLVLGKVDGEYRLISGHRRISAIALLVSEGFEEYQYIPCRYKEMTETQFRIELLIGNTFNRKMTDFDLMMEAREWKEVLTQARKEKLVVLEKGERIRNYVAIILGESDGKIGTLEAINKKAIPEIKEQMQNGNIGITAAYAASQLPEEKQKEIVNKAADKHDIMSEEIQSMAEEEKGKKKKPEEELKKINVSDTDTNEEEKANAKRLHVLKMLERYYIYMSDEELGIFERILEDCKRRKREYAIEEE